MRKFSKKRQKVNRQYSKLAKEFLTDRTCEIHSPNCIGEAQGVHHVRGRGIYLMDQSTWKASCSPCNLYVEDHHEWALKNGHKESRLKKYA